MKNNSETTFTIDRDNLEVTMERVFDAPPDLVFKAYTDPALIPEWWGPRNTATTIEKMEPREGGEWRFISSDGEREDVFYGEFKEIKEPNLITWTFNYEPAGPGHEIMETVRFEEMGEDSLNDESGVTKVTTVSKYKSLEDLEGMVNAGMEGGARESWERLEGLLEDLKEDMEEGDVEEDAA